MRSDTKQITWLVIFSIAMGFLESAVVIYLRSLYYPHGFEFPLASMAPTVTITELLREAATIIMLAGVAILAGRSSYQRFAFFLIAFAVWDISYYVFLKLVLDWPESLFTWDILFLLPIPWIGPVFTPFLVSLTMILLGFVVNNYRAKRESMHIKRREWILLFSGSFVVVLSWTLDYFLQEGGTIIPTEKSTSLYATYIPEAYNWWLFSLGESLLLLGIFSLFARSRHR